MKLDLVLVATGAVGGAILRHSVSEYGKARAQGPAAILCVNVVGSFALGAVSAAAAPQKAQLLLGTGFCGAFTTFSTFSMDTIRLVNERKYLAAAAYVASTNALSIGAAGAGFAIGSAVRASPAALPFLVSRGLQSRRRDSGGPRRGGE